MTDSANTKDYRQFPRVNSESIIAVRPVTARRKKILTTTSKVVGLGGLMFESGTRMRKGQRLELEILAGVDLIKLNVKVAWCRKGENGLWQVGVDFQDISDEDQVKLLDSLMRRVFLDEEMGQ